MSAKFNLIYVEPIPPGWRLGLIDRSSGNTAYLHTSALDWRRLTQADVDAIDRAIKSDGCSSVPDFYRNGCVMHDFWYRTHKDFDGTPITRAQADSRMRKYIQSKSPFGIFSPMAMWRLAGVRIGGSGAWRS